MKDLGTSEALDTDTTDTNNTDTAETKLYAMLQLIHIEQIPEDLPRPAIKLWEKVLLQQLEDETSFVHVFRKIFKK